MEKTGIPITAEMIKAGQHALDQTNDRLPRPVNWATVLNIFGAMRAVELSLPSPDFLDGEKRFREIEDGNLQGLEVLRKLVDFLRSENVLR